MRRRGGRGRRVAGRLTVQSSVGTPRSGQGVLRLGRRRITWRFRGGGPAGAVAWGDVVDWSVGRDTRLGVARHTHCLTVTFPAGRLWLQTKGPWGALELAHARSVFAARSRCRVDDNDDGAR